MRLTTLLLFGFVFILHFKHREIIGKSCSYSWYYLLSRFRHIVFNVADL